MNSKNSVSKNSSHIPKFSYITLDIWTLIFTTLPVKTLVRFRCVCKSWRSIIDNPVFVSFHRKLGKKNTLLLGIEWFGLDGRSGCMLTVRRTDTLEPIDCVFSDPDRDHSYRVLWSCDGLLLVNVDDVLLSKKELRIWNPSIRKSLSIPPCPFPQALLSDAEYVFGYAPLANEYKVIAFAFENTDDGYEVTEMKVAVFTLSDQRWNVKNNDSDLSCSYLKTMFGSRLDPACSVYFEGAAHWLADDPCGFSHITHLVTFDFDVEKFTRLKLPLTFEDGASVVHLFILLESLAIFCISEKGANVWVLEDDWRKGVWAQWFSGPPNQDGLDMFYSCAASDLNVLFYQSDEGGYFLCSTKSYNVASGEVRTLGTSPDDPDFDLIPCSESLVFCKGYGAQDLKSLP